MEFTSQQWHGLLLVPVQSLTEKTIGNKARKSKIVAINNNFNFNFIN